MSSLSSLESRCLCLESEILHLQSTNQGLSVPLPGSLPPTKTSEAKYLSLLTQTAALSDKLVADRTRHAERVTELQSSLEERRAKTQTLVNAFRELKRSTCEVAGKNIPISVIHELEDFEVEKEAELSEVRGAWISLTRKLKNAHRKLRQRDQLAKNLHVVDFEQLKLENQSLNERIEAKLDEKTKGERKLHGILQSEAHVSMRLSALRKKTKETSENRETLTQRLLEVRERLIGVKKDRDRLALENADAKRRAKLKNDKALMDDYKRNLQTVADLEKQVHAMQIKLNST